MPLEPPWFAVLEQESIAKMRCVEAGHYSYERAVRRAQELAEAKPDTWHCVTNRERCLEEVIYSDGRLRRHDLITGRYPKPLD